MTRRLLLLAMAISLLAACEGATPTPVPTAIPISALTATPIPVSTATPTPAPTHTPTLVPTSTKVGQRPEKVVVLSIDGVRADNANKFIADGTMPNLARLVARGVKAEYAQSIDPTLTAAAHASIATGTYPNKTGIVANTFRLPHQYIYETVSGFDDVEWGAEPIWRAAMRAGLRTAVVFWPGAGVSFPDKLADYTVAYGASDAYSAQHVLSFAPASGWENAPPSFSPPKEASLRITRGEGLLAEVEVLAMDTSDDQTENYDLFILDLDKRIGEESGRLTEGQWARLLISDRLWSGAYFKITDPDMAHFTVFQSRVNYNQARPVKLLREINERFGFFPPSPDYYALEHGWITEGDYFEMIERQARWTMDVATYVYTAYQPDLMLTWQGATDECGHQFMMVDERQWNYSPQRAAEYADLYRRAHQLADENLGQLMEALDLDEAALLVVSDHGMAPIHSYVNVNAALIRAGLMVLEDTVSYYIDTARTKANAVTSGGAVHVYVNLRGRERGGSVPPEEYEEVREEVIAVLSAITDPVDGKPVFQRILRREELGELRLDGENAGDVFAQVRLGYYPDYHRDRTELIQPVEFYGQHGYDSTLPEMRAMFVGAGPGIAEGKAIGPVHLVDVAPSVARLLGFAPPEGVDGRVLKEMLLSQ
jgi:predicted AlkP superfamily phosphohydrolase/phosphomutase